MLGYSKIPEYWKMGLKEAEDIKFKYTTMSLNDVYALGYKHAIQVVEKNGGRLEGDNVIILVQTPKAVRLEQSFAGHFPIEKRPVHKDIDDEFTFDFEGNGFVVMGEASPKHGSSWDYKGSFVFEAELYIDDQKVETAKLPANYTTRRLELFWKYQLPKAKHNVKIKLLNPDSEFKLRVTDIVLYTDQVVQAPAYK
jgi:hypothetical protein